LQLQPGMDCWGCSGGRGRHARHGAPVLAGFKKLAEVAKAKMPSLSACQVTDLTVGLYK
jgi:hypothetical protein